MEKEKLISLVCAARQGDEQAITELFNAFHDDLYYHIYKTVNDPTLAEDLLQDTFIEVLQTIHQLNEPTAFVTWSKQIAYHKCTAYFKKRREILADEDEDGHFVFDTIEEDRSEFIPDEALDKEDLKQTIHNIISELPPEQRSAILMRYFDEISVKEIAEIQGVSEGTVKSRLNYGRKSIKEAVETYEKKNGVKLHCAGVIPLLLWLFREYAVTNGISLTAGGASATYTAANATTSVLAEGAKAATEVAGKFAVKKLIAGIVAAAVVSGGVIGVLLSRNKPAPEPQLEKPIMEWYGYGKAVTSTRRFDFSVDQMDDTYISGNLVVSALYEPYHETHFEGEGVVSEEAIIYTLKFETPAVLGAKYSEMKVRYNKGTDQFVFNEAYVYEVTMNRKTAEPSELLTQNETWSGYGEDGFDNSYKADDLFTLEIYEQRVDEIKGKLTVSDNGNTDHETEFVGRGYESNGKIYYEILLETPRTMNYVIKYTLNSFWLSYNTQTETFKTSALEMYAFELRK